MLLLPIYSTAIKGWSKVNYHLSSIYDCPYLSCNDHCDWRLFQEIAIVISKKFFWTILSLFFFLEFKHIYKTQRTNLFTFSFFNGCFKIILCINILHLFVLFHCVQTHRMSSFFASCFAITLCNKALHLCTWTGSLKPSLKWTFYVI